MTDRIQDVRGEAARVVAASSSPEEAAERLDAAGLLPTGLSDAHNDPPAVHAATEEPK